MTGRQLHLLLAQINPVTGDLQGNAALMLDIWGNAPLDTDLIIFPELAMCGYPAEDLILKKAFLDEAGKQVETIRTASAGFSPAALITAPLVQNEKIYNAAYLIEGGIIKACILKHDLPHYGIFDEHRIFSTGPLPDAVPFRGLKLGIMICEDMWSPLAAAHLAGQGSDILIVSNASPYDFVNAKARRLQAVARAREVHLPVVYVNQIGGQDELVFDGHSFVMSETGGLIFSGAAFAENIYPVRLEQSPQGRWHCPDAGIGSSLQENEEIYSALVLGLRDYVGKNNFPGVLLGLSGGIDSALSAVIAADALGPDKVRCVMMPSQYTSPESTEDAALLAQTLGIRLDTIPIEGPVSAFNHALSSFLQGAPAVTFENIQPRVRGVMLMALSNANGALVLTTGNKSEIAAGYATLYGDMCGGFNALKDVYKTQVYALARWRNEHTVDGGLGPAGASIPQRILTRAPSAELKPDQTDQDTLPPYEILDAVLHGLIEENLGQDDIVARGYERPIVEKIAQMLDASEYKRRQSAPGTKISPRAFGRDRRYPMTHKFRENH